MWRRWRRGGDTASRTEPQEGLCLCLVSVPSHRPPLATQPHYEREKRFQKS